jgi:hypothetical protein
MSAQTEVVPNSELSSKLRFNRAILVARNLGIEQPSDDEIRKTPPLFNASLEDALLYGGDLTRAALSSMRIRGDKKYVIVDTKVHMLMPGMWPAIPGWHTDGVPRPDGKPDIWAQEEMESPRFHLLVTGEGCLTDFCNEPLDLEVPAEPTSDLYADISKQMNELAPSTWRIPSCRAVEWGWWDLHTAIRATKREWRFLIRVTETNYRPPKTDLRDVLRTQQQVYVESAEFGW